MNIGGYDYDRVQAIMDGQVGMDGYDVRFDPADIYAVTVATFGTEQTYDVTEIGLLPFIERFINQDFRDYTLIPAFVSRTFRHRNIYVHTASGIERPEDLRGKRIGTPGYGFSAHTWIRGFLADQYGVMPDDMQWIETTASSDGGAVNKELNRRYLPDDFPLEKGPPGVDESELLISGGCDALVTAITPKAFLENNPKIRQLFPNIKTAEQAYYQETGVFPIMHAVGIRTELIASDPKLPEKVFKMYSAAKQAAYDNLASTTALRITLPWSVQEFESTQTLMGQNYWSYGIGDNRKELELVMRYAHEQGLIKRPAEYLEVFHQSTHDLSEV